MRCHDISIVIIYFMNKINKKMSIASWEREPQLQLCVYQALLQFLSVDSVSYMPSYKILCMLINYLKNILTILFISKYT